MSGVRKRAPLIVERCFSRASLLLHSSFGAALLLLGGFWAHPCTASEQKKGIPYQEGAHASYEVCLTNHDAPTFSLQVSPLDYASELKMRQGGLPVSALF